MNVRIALLAFPLVALAQPSSQSPPPELDRALRARANEFVQCYVDGTFKKAYDELVAPDTKDLYFGAPRTRIKSFELGEVKYFDNFTRAEITVNAVKEMMLLGQSVPSNLTEVEKFKLVNGVWFWYDLPAEFLITPMGASKIDTTGTPSMPTAPMPTDLSPEGLQAMARQLLGQTSVDKSEVVLATDKPSESKVVFHNGMGGAVQVRFSSVGELPGFSVKMDKTDVGAREDATLLLRFEPSGQAIPASPLGIRLTVSPTNQVFTIAVKFAAATK